MSYASNEPRRTAPNVRRWLVLAAAAAALALPGVASASDLPRGIMGATNDDAGQYIGAMGGAASLTERTPTELAQRVPVGSEADMKITRYVVRDASPQPAPQVASPDPGFSWADAAVGAGVLAAIVAVGSGAVLLRRRGHTAAHPAV